MDNAKWKCPNSYTLYQQNVRTTSNTSLEIQNITSCSLVQMSYRTDRLNVNRHDWQKKSITATYDRDQVCRNEEHAVRSAPCWRRDRNHRVGPSKAHLSLVHLKSRCGPYGLCHRIIWSSRRIPTFRRNLLTLHTTKQEAARPSETSLTHAPHYTLP